MDGLYDQNADIWRRRLGFLAIVLTALALVPAGAHLSAMPVKLTLGRDSYFVVQGIYRGWALFGIIIFAAFAANIGHAVRMRRARSVFALSLAAAGLIAVGLAVFFVWTYPANQATADWTRMPASWDALRMRWEFGHAANAAATFLALCCATWAGLSPAEDDKGKSR
jgi:hypothetical protein